MNVDLKLLGVFDALEKKINALDNRFDGLSKQVGPKGDKGEKGDKGDKGADGKKGADGAKGADGRNGVDGRDGRDGQDGVSVVDANIDLDGHLVLRLSNGDEIDAGELTVGAGETINYYQTGGSGGTGTGNASIQYTNVSTTPYYIASADLVEGTNIYGVDAGQDAFIYLPTAVSPTKLITINNESGSFNLTIDTYVE